MNQSFLSNYHFIKDTSTHPSMPLKDKLEEIKELPKGMMSIYFFVDKVTCFVLSIKYYFMMQTNSKHDTGLITIVLWN